MDYLKLNKIKCAFLDKKYSISYSEGIDEALLLRGDNFDGYREALSNLDITEQENKYVGKKVHVRQKGGRGSRDFGVGEVLSLNKPDGYGRLGSSITSNVKLVDESKESFPFPLEWLTIIED